MASLGGFDPGQLAAGAINPYSLLGGGGGNGPSYGKAGKKQVNLNVLFPLLMQGMYASAALGQDPIAFLNSFKVDAKGAKSAGKSGADSGFVHVGGSYYDIGSLSKALPGLLQQQQDKVLSDKKATYDKLAGTPQFASIFQDAADPSVNFNKNYGDAYTSMAGAAGGAASASGFYADPNKQAAALGPLALQKAQYLTGIQQNAKAQALGLAGIGPMPSPSDYLQAGSPGSYQSGIFNVANLNQQQNQFDAQLGFQKSAQNQNMWMGVLGSAAGAAAFACWVADELWGADDERTHAARLWATTHDTPFLRLYKAHGKGWAAWLHENEWAKPLVEPIWLAMARMGAPQMREGMA